MLNLLAAAALREASGGDRVAQPCRMAPPGSQRFCGVPMRFHCVLQACLRAAGAVSLLVLVAAPMLGPAAAAAPDPLENFYANTLESRHQDGKVFRVYLERDRSYHVLDEQGQTVRQGTYSFEHDKLCFFGPGKAADPGKAECPPFRADLKFGETWDALTSSGKHDYLTLRPGR